MFTINDRAAVWIGDGAKELIFYPFGIEKPGYRVPGDREDALARWTFWRAQLPVILWFLGFVPVVAALGAILVEVRSPSTAVGCRRLDSPHGGVLGAGQDSQSRALLLVAEGLSGPRSFPDALLKRQASVKQHGVSYKNIAFSCFPVATLGIIRLRPDHAARRHTRGSARCGRLERWCRGYSGMLSTSSFSSSDGRWRA